MFSQMVIYEDIYSNTLETLPLYLRYRFSITAFAWNVEHFATTCERLIVFLPAISRTSEL